MRAGRRTAAIVLAAALGVSGASAQEPQPTPDPTDLINALLASLLGFQPMSEAELSKEVAEVGGIPFQRAVPLDYMTRAEMERYFRELIDSEYPKERAAIDERTLLAFDLLPAGSDLRASRSRLLLDNVVGFYDERPSKRRLYAVSSDRSLTPANQLILAHELRHALQDQYMSIHGLLPDTVSDFDDRRLALLGLLEGDATLLMERFLAKRVPGLADALSSPGLALPTPDLPGAPPVLRDQLVEPYLTGLEFARALHQRGGWEALRSAWSRPPESTEQVLHPEKFFDREPPRKVEVLLAPPGGRLLTEGVLGELLARTLVGREPPAATAGWGGDLYKLWDVSGRTVLVWRSVWDTPGDAGEFLSAALARFRSSYGNGAEHKGFVVLDAKRWKFALGEWAGSVVLLSSDDPELFGTMLGRLAPR
jgi:hypothetical protein